ncbi:MAG: DUF1700 domain-containing protein [Ruminococcaceae bacterium]|nr:DUF1700 domain-containing protein [Oscillospiraceae bacterium]
MNKKEFLLELQKGLSCLPSKDVEERINFYSEIIDDRMEEGLTECEAVGEIGEVQDIVTQILADTPPTKLVKENVKKNRRLNPWEIVFLVLGSPIWLSLLISAFAVIFSFFVVIWSIVISLWAVEISIIASSLGVILASLLFFFQGKTLTALAVFGAGVLSLGLSIFLFFGCKAFTKGIAILTKKIALMIKKSIIGKGRA